MGISEKYFNPDDNSGLLRSLDIIPEKLNKKRENIKPNTKSIFDIFNTISLPCSIEYLGKKYEKTLGSPAVNITSRVL